MKKSSKNNAIIRNLNKKRAFHYRNSHINHFVEMSEISDLAILEA
jgi:hypothetical protein